VNYSPSGLYHWYTAYLRKTKIFTNGRGQAVRIPKDFRFDVPEVYIRKDETTGDVVLSTKDPAFNCSAFFDELRSIPEEERNLLPERSVIVTKRRDQDVF
jgi:antitoxin VapB